MVLMFIGLMLAIDIKCVGIVQLSYSPRVGF